MTMPVNLSPETERFVKGITEDAVGAAQQQQPPMVPGAKDVIPSCKPTSWDDFLSAIEGPGIPADFLSEKERDPAPHARDPFDGWRE